MNIQTDALEASGNYVTRLAEGIPQKRYTPFREGDDLSVKFVEGVANLAIDFRVKNQNELIRVWIVMRTEICAGTQMQMPVYVYREEREKGESTCFFADVGIENNDGISKGVKGRGVFQSLFSQHFLEISPPYWWTTGYPAVDASTRRRQCGEDSVNGILGGPDSIYLYPAGADLLDAIRSVRLQVFPWGFTTEPSDDRLEVVDAFAGPF